MTTTREQISSNNHPNSSLIPEDFHLIDTPEIIPPPLCPPPNLPKYSIAMSRFAFLRKEEEDREGKKSFHVVNTAKKNNDGEKFFIKHNDPESYMSELELVCWIWYKMTARHVVPKKVYACYDNQFRFVGIASQEIPEFKSNRISPLQEKDLIIDALDHDFNYQRNHLIEILTSLSKILHRTVVTESVISTFWNCVKYSYNAYVSSNPTAVQVQWQCDYFLSDNADFSPAKLCDLTKKLYARQTHINDHPATEECQAENILLTKAIQQAKSLSDIQQDILLTQLKNKDYINILKLESMNKFAKKNNYDLGKMNDASKIEGEIQGEHFTVSVKDLKNYRLIQGLAEGTVASYVNAENDYHSQNGSKDGFRIDFDMSEWKFLSQFKECNYFDWIMNWKSTPEDPFLFTERDIRNFPVLQDAIGVFRYWPTKSDLVSKSGLNITPAMFENFYTSENSEMFKKLRFHPAFIFHKFKAFLKTILVTDDMLRESAALCMRDNIKMPNSDKNVLEEFVSYKINRMQKLKKVLLDMPMFRDFLVKNKDTIFESIRQEFEEDIAEFKNEMEREGNNHHRKLISTINLKAMEKEFNRILGSIDPTLAGASVEEKTKSSCASGM